MTSTEDRGIITRAVAALPERHRLVLGLWYCDGLNALELARVLRISHVDASKRVTAALGLLKQDPEVRAILERRSSKAESSP
jgi:DNA-directed RNA polymerase specialized sigma subunit